jgi:hypothetical protein
VTGNGITGAQGSTGSTGYTGSTGVTGATGPQALIYDRITPAGSGSFTISNGKQALIVNQNLSGPISTFSITLPAAPVDGQLMIISFNNTITNFTLSPNAGQTIAQTPPTTIPGPVAIKLIYDGIDQIWFPA